MTNLEALQSCVQFDDTNLFTKVLLDRGISGTTVYTLANKNNIDLCLADICLYIILHPKFREASKTIKYSTVELITTAKRIYREQEDWENLRKLGTVRGTKRW